jgi:hypothetical protein
MSEHEAESSTARDSTARVGVAPPSTRNIHDEVNTSRTQLPHQEQTEEEVQEVPPRDGRREKQREKRRQSKIHDGDEVFEFTIDWLQRNTGNVTELFSIMNNALQQRDQQHERS